VCLLQLVSDGAQRVAGPGRITRVANDDSDFVEVLRAELPRLQRFARLLTGNADTAEDLVAEAIARVLPRWRVGEVDDTSAYVRRVIVNLAMRRGRRRVLGVRSDRYALDWLPTHVDSEAFVGERDRTLKAIIRLPERRRAVVVLRFYEDMTEAQIADVLKIGIGTVKSQLSRALDQLRRDLATQEES
jgi:RNA polymerase sigma-70 factor (sigma-E family)